MATAKRKPPNAGKGRPKGVPNKATADVRRAFAALVEGAGPKLEGWLTRVAKDDPARALTIVRDFAEYHIPKLQRTEVTGADGGPVQIVRKYFGTKAQASANDRDSK